MDPAPNFPQNPRSQIYKDPLRIPKMIGEPVTYEEARILRGHGVSSTFTPMISLGPKGSVPDPTENRTQFVDSHISIRILNLLPAKPMLDDIECELHVVRLVDKPIYEALSYTWGDENHRRFIQVNGQRLSVTSSFWAALRYLRRSSDSRWLWVDAVCIDQLNITEKNYMVSQMHVVYHNAQRVIAWLGEPTIKSVQAFGFLAKYLRQCPQLADDMENVRAVVDNSPPMRDVSLQTWDALLDVFGRPWWSRAWIAQEINCARSGWTLQCGMSEISGNQLSCVLTHFFDALEASDVPTESKIILDQGPFAVLMLKIHTQDRLGNVLAMNRRRKAKDDRDKVYAFTNMFYPPLDELKPDYETSTAELYYQTAVQIVLKSGNLQILSAVENHTVEELAELHNIDGVPQRFTPGLPSWVPDWSRDRLTNELWGGLLTEGGKCPFNASGDYQSEFKIHEGVLEQSKGLLTIKVKQIARVDFLGRDFHGMDISEGMTSGFDLISGGAVVVPIGQNAADSVLRTSTLDRDAEGERAYDDIAKEPAELRRSLLRACIGRRMFRSSEGFVGLGPRSIKVNDLVMLIPGCHVPIILRPGVYITGRSQKPCTKHQKLGWCLKLGCAKVQVSVAQRYEVIGETYLHGIMNGELSSLLEDNLQEIVLAGIEEKFAL